MNKKLEIFSKKLHQNVKDLFSDVEINAEESKDGYYKFSKSGYNFAFIYMYYSSGELDLSIEHAVSGKKFSLSGYLRFYKEEKFINDYSFSCYDIESLKEICDVFFMKAMNLCRTVCDDQSHFDDSYSVISSSSIDI